MATGFRKRSCARKNETGPARAGPLDAFRPSGRLPDVAADALPVATSDKRPGPVAHSDSAADEGRLFDQRARIGRLVDTAAADARGRRAGRAGKAEAERTQTDNTIIRTSGSLRLVVCVPARIGMTRPRATTNRREPDANDLCCRSVCAPPPGFAARPGASASPAAAVSTRRPMRARWSTDSPQNQILPARPFAPTLPLGARLPPRLIGRLADASSRQRAGPFVFLAHDLFFFLQTGFHPIKSRTSFSDHALRHARQSLRASAAIEIGALVGRRALRPAWRTCGNTVSANPSAIS